MAHFLAPLSADFGLTFLAAIVLSPLISSTIALSSGRVRTSIAVPPLLIMVIMIAGGAAMAVLALGFLVALIGSASGLVLPLVVGRFFEPPLLHEPAAAYLPRLGQRVWRHMRARSYAWTLVAITLVATLAFGLILRSSRISHGLGLLPHAIFACMVALLLVWLGGLWRGFKRGFKMLDLVLTAVIMIGLGVAALPAYQDYAIRTRVSEIILAGSRYQAAISERIKRDQDPAHAGAGLTFSPAGKPPILGRVAPNGTITAEDMHFSVTLTPSYNAADATVSWNCKVTPSFYTPPTCR